ncbi:hypothetical protein [Quadrisphaera sp. INWT6]|uniref:hypothetical protein n=1 Tax=Quadrisphaera sp. INWT6 TaxID=2596917 RepID=UPI001892261C|nr:hypothetical protein [Quadrisphaera sp. INWT6]MBF5083321.1 glycosyltransferase [Quadrisphaera sp. INWT6]
MDDARPVWQGLAEPQEPTFACSPPPGTARVDVVLAAAGGRVPQWVLRRLPEGYRPVPVPMDASAPDGLSSAWAVGLSRSTAPVVALLDGRSGVDPHELERLAEPVARGSADVVAGARRAGLGPSALACWPPHRRLAARRATRRLQQDPALAALRPTDAVPALAGRRQLLAAVAVPGPRELLAAAADGGWRFAEVPVRCGSGTLSR